MGELEHDLLLGHGEVFWSSVATHLGSRVAYWTLPAWITGDAHASLEVGRVGKLLSLRKRGAQFSAPALSPPTFLNVPKLLSSLTCRYAAFLRKGFV